MVVSLLRINDMKRYYEMVSGTVKALDGVDLEVKEGERIILLGPSGSGKTTLLNCIAALDSPTAGTYSFEGKEVPRNTPVEKKRLRTGIEHWSMRPIDWLLGILLAPVEYFTHSRPEAKANEQMTSFRRDNIGYVFQFFNLLQDLTVLENILLIQELGGGRDEKRARELLALVGLEAEVDRFPTEISGGQQQRVAIARSLAKKPKLLLGDELTGNLDTKTSSMVMKVLVNACEAEGITTVFVTHDESLIRYATRVIRLDSGIVITDQDA
ncbi:MAG: ABC transporter ATP-binding protein [Candidatus Thalassarchaeaceae archaeon]|jgi:putative ABC transport system ATP-binding protein|nr:ABC transporter ATP-binding protein [Candidatus Thalassarchaeaceae archaeon]